MVTHSISYGSEIPLSERCVFPEPLTAGRSTTGNSAGECGQVLAGHFGAVSPRPSAKRTLVPRWKRAFDLAFILLISPILVVVYAVCALYIKLVSRGPVFFRQERVGLLAQPFVCLKFRTMRYRANEGVHNQYLSTLINSNRPMTKLDAAGDSRLIPLGGLLRSTGLDELPQLINVLRGEMSIVGPRPCTVHEFKLYKPHHKQRLRALPGLTGLWQVSGKNSTTFEEMVQLDITYAETQTLGNDLRIIWRTFPTLWGQVGKHVARQRGGEARRSPRTQNG